MNQNRKIKSKKRAVKAMALSMAAAMSMTLFPVSAFAEKAGTGTAGRNCESGR